MRSPTAVLTHYLAFLSASNVVDWFSFGRFRFSSAIAWDAIFLTRSVTLIRSLSSMLVLGTTAPVMRETDLKLCKVNQHPISRLPRHLLTRWLWLRLWFHLERFFGLLLARFFVGSVSTFSSCAAALSSSSASSANSSSVKKWHLLTGSVFNQMCLCL